MALTASKDDPEWSAELQSFPVLHPLELDSPGVKQVMGRLLRGGRVLREYQNWMRHGFRPIFLEGIRAYPERLLAVVEKTIAMDIPFLIPQLDQGNLQFMSAVIGYLAQSSVPVLAVNSLCREWGIGKEKLYKLLGAMEQAQLIRIIRKHIDRSLHWVGAKIFLQDPSLYHALDGDRGTAREALVVACLQEAGFEVFAHENEKEADFIVALGGIGPRRKGFTIEVGGSSKKRKRADYVIRDGIDESAPGLIPLWTLGFAY